MRFYPVNQKICMSTSMTPNLILKLIFIFISDCKLSETKMGCFKTLKISKVTFKYAQLVKTHGNNTVQQIIYLKDRYMFLYV